MSNNEEEFSQKAFEDLLKRWRVAQKTMEKLQQDKDMLTQQNQILVAEKNQWQQQKVMQEQIIQNHLSNSDGSVKALEGEIVDLRAEIKVLKAELGKED